MHGQHELFVHIGIWRRVFMQKRILSGRLDVCQNIFDSFLVMAVPNSEKVNPAAIAQQQVFDFTCAAPRCAARDS